MKRRDPILQLGEVGECAYTNYSTNCVINRIVSLGFARRDKVREESDGERDTSALPSEFLDSLRTFRRRMSNRISAVAPELKLLSANFPDIGIVRVDNFFLVVALIRERERERDPAYLR